MVDARGYLCPMPVVMVQKAVKDGHPAEIEVLLDDACAAGNLNMVDRELLQNAVLHKPAEQELAMTGRDPAPWMLDAADYITEMSCRRHPYEKGIPARKGVEF